MNPHLIMPLSVLPLPVIAGASIFSILQNPIKDKNDDYFVVVTDEVSNDVIKRVCVDLEAKDWCLGETFYMPVL